MAILEIQDLNFTYPGENRPALQGINLTVEEGEFLVLCGPSGSGKTTLLRHLKKELAPTGLKTGAILYQGIPFAQVAPEISAREIGMVFQDPESQIVMEQVIHELAFTLENFGTKPAIIKKRIGEMAAFFGLEKDLYKPVHQLSGGQKQILNLCSVLMTRPRVLLLDEPTSQLDPIAAKEFLKMVHELNREFSISVVLSEHRLEEAFSLGDRIFFLDRGSLKYAGAPENFSRQIVSRQDKQALAFLPSVTRFFYFISGRQGEQTPAAPPPFTVRDGKEFFRKLQGPIAPLPEVKEESRPEPLNSDPLLECRDIYFRYAKDSQPILKGLSLDIGKSDFWGILGGNGAGKTTLLQILAGLLQPQQGRVFFNRKRLDRLPAHEKYRRIGYVAQNPLLHFTFDTVQEEMQFALHRWNPEAGEEKLREIVNLLALSPVVNKHPYDCSGGEQQKIALACALVGDPSVLLLDEPTKGLDALSKEKLAGLLTTLQNKGVTIIMVTHDVEFAAGHTQKCGLLFDGEILYWAEPKEFFGGNYFYTTALNRVTRDFLPGIITYKDVIKEWQIPS